MNPGRSSFFERASRSLRTRYLKFRDASEVFLGLRHPLIPPKRYDYINAGKSTAIAREFLEYFVSIGDLKPTDKVLEVGSGFGRMAIPLTGYLKDTGRYEGLEIIKDGVNWCLSEFTPRYPNFNFRYIDVYNQRYNPGGTVEASAFTFPFDDNSFDFIYLTSVFTHMFPEDMKRYLSEASRVLRSGGTSFITYFLLDNNELPITGGNPAFSFGSREQDCFIEDPEHPEYAIAYNEEFIRSLYPRHRLRLVEPIRYGSWSGRVDHLSFQDAIIAKKI